jgi:hypothetical protein
MILQEDGRKNREKDDLSKNQMECPVSWAVLNLAVDFHSGHLLSAGVPWSLLGALAPVGSPQPRTPAGVKCPPLQSTGLKNHQCLLTQPMAKKDGQIILTTSSSLYIMMSLLPDQKVYYSNFWQRYTFY